MYDLSVCRPGKNSSTDCKRNWILGCRNYTCDKRASGKGTHYGGRSVVLCSSWNCGFYYGAILAGILIVVSLRVFSIVDKNFLKYNKYMNFYVEYNSKVFIRELIFYAKKSGYQILDLEITKDSSSGTYFATFQLKITNPSLRTLVLASVQELPDCILAEEM